MDTWGERVSQGTKTANAETLREGCLVRDSDSREASEAGAERVRASRQKVKSDLGLMEEGLVDHIKDICFYLVN